MINYMTKISLILLCSFLWGLGLAAQALDEDDFVPSSTQNGTASLIDGSITAAKLADNIITTDKISNGSILSEDLAVNAISEVGTKYISLDVGSAVRTSLALGSVGGGFSASPVLRYDGSGVSYGLWSIPVPDDWQAGTDMVLELFWSPSSSNGAGTKVQWQLYYKAFAAGSVVPGSDSYSLLTYTQDTPLATLSLTNTSNNLNIPAADLSADTMLNIALARDGGNGNNANDDYNNDANVHMVRLKYQAKKVK
jgi:hypothetical protein